EVNEPIRNQREHGERNRVRDADEQFDAPRRSSSHQSRTPEFGDERRRKPRAADAPVERPAQQQKLGPTSKTRRRGETGGAPLEVESDERRHEQRERRAQPGG